MKRVYLLFVLLFLFIYNSTVFASVSESLGNFIENISENTIIENNSVSVFVELNYEIPSNGNIKESEEYFTTQNRKYLKSMNLDFKVWDFSSFSPFVYRDFEDYISYSKEKQEIQGIQYLSCVKRVFIQDNYMEEESPTVSNAENSPVITLDEAKELMNADNTSYTGKGIKIGILDVGILDVDYPFSKDYLKESRGISPTEHTRAVGTILGGNYGIAREAELYFSQVITNLDDSEYNNYKFIKAFEWLLSKEINIINMSMNLNRNGLYDGYSAYVDYCVNQYKFSFVKSAGNNYIVSSPGMGMNVITVGALNANQEVWIKTGQIENTSAYKDKIQKPTLMAFGVNLDIKLYKIDTGTSYAAPMVTGIIALLMEEFPVLKEKPDLVLTALITGARMIPGQTDLFEGTCGAGLIDYQATRKILKSQSYWTFNFLSDHGNGMVNSIEMYIDNSVGFEFCLLHCISSSESVIPSNQAADLSFTSYRVRILDSAENEITSVSSISNFCLFYFENNLESQSFVFEFYIYGNNLDIGNYELVFAYI